MAWPLPYCIEVAPEPYTDSRRRRHKQGPVNERNAKVKLREEKASVCVVVVGGKGCYCKHLGKYHLPKLVCLHAGCRKPTR